MARQYKRKRSYGKRTRYSRRRAQTAARSSAVTRARGRTSWRNRMFRTYRNPLTLTRLKTTVHYNQVISLDPKPNTIGAGGSNMWQFRANSLFDPDASGAGHQPMYHDNYANLYQKYRVNYSVITVTVINHFVNTATSNSSGSVTVQPNYAYKLFIYKDGTATEEYPSATGGMDQLLEEGGNNIKWRFIAPSLTGKLPKLKMGCTPHVLTNRSFGDDTLFAKTTESPSAGAFFYIGVTSADGATDPPSVYLNVHIKYYCEYFERNVNQSEN